MLHFHLGCGRTTWLSLEGMRSAICILLNVNVARMDNGHCSTESLVPERRRVVGPSLWNYNFPDIHPITPHDFAQGRFRVQAK